MISARQLVLPFGTPASLTGEDFLVAAPNAEAVQCLQRWPDWRSTALTLWGPTGCGKTHLSHVFLARSEGMLVSHEALAFDQAIDVAARATVCIVDDADQAVAEGFEKPLLHLHNTLGERGGHLLLTAQTPPVRWQIGLADLRSRLLAADAVGIGTPDDQLIAGVLVKLFADRRLKVDEEIILYALPRIERSFAAARRLVADLDAAALGQRRKLTVALLREVLGARVDDERD
jgi:chromosomal replication initiation ATPase DnaA